MALTGLSDVGVELGRGCGGDRRGVHVQLAQGDARAARVVEEEIAALLVDVDLGADVGRDHDALLHAAVTEDRTRGT